MRQSARKEIAAPEISRRLEHLDGGYSIKWLVAGTTEFAMRESVTAPRTKGGKLVD